MTNLHVARKVGASFVAARYTALFMFAAVVACGDTDDTTSTMGSAAGGMGGMGGAGGMGGVGGAGGMGGVGGVGGVGGMGGTGGAGGMGGVGGAGGMGGMGGAGGAMVDFCTDPPPAESVTSDAMCQFTAPPGELNPVVKWRKDTFDVAPAYNQVIVTPVVGNLNDDNGDGMVDAKDVPDIVFTTYSGSTGWFGDGYLRAISGKDGAELWSVPGPRGAAGVAIGDADRNGSPEVYTIDNGGSLLAFDNLGTPLWSCPAGVGAYGYPAIADADGTGNAEILAGSTVCASDGQVRVKTALFHDWYFGALDFHSPTSFFVDLDQDGTMEIVSGVGVSRLDGSTLWTGPGGHAAVANFDIAGADPMMPEIVVVHAGTVSILHPGDGTTIWSRSGVLGAYGGPPTVADFDGDGKPEIGVAASAVYAVLDPEDADGVLWTAPIQDNTSFVTGSSVFDFNGDAKAEVVYADEQTLWIFDGSTGNVVAQMSEHVSATYHEYPVMADVDADGHADIVLASNNGYFAGPWTGITVLSGADNDWATGRPVWNQHAYHITNVDDDLRSPAKEMPHWLGRNSFREGGFSALGALVAPDLVPVVFASCNESCPASGRLVFRVENRGAGTAPVGLSWAIQGVAQDGTKTLLASGKLDEPLAPGWSSKPLESTVEASTAAGFVSLVLSVDEDGAGNAIASECVENNNEITLPAICP
ncbi:FG-GAP-like repeat-containing protein [Polyangium sp. y55x31]|uniref:FG-GAP-like repeat-containing protein n=1 Tax=Polyangium sp. y55x31 TaxID=3042688 RepID=UPI002482D947|nr:FG-GAP-like repeat-containing protein [Polyangium sp. y55x31]MDI1476254.1 FG-GAP-like repeat-containing protein [Polyangium sp. y55x31]